jgi:hypothetical protein
LLIPRIKPCSAVDGGDIKILRIKAAYMSLSFLESFLAGGLIINIASLAGKKGEGGEGKERGRREGGR